MDSRNTWRRSPRVVLIILRTKIHALLEICDIEISGKIMARVENPQAVIAFTPLRRPEISWTGTT